MSGVRRSQRRLGLDLDNLEAGARHLSHTSATFVAASADGRWVATGAHHEKGVKVWDARSGELLRHLIADETGARASFSPDDRWLITETSQDFRLWRTGSWDPVWHLRREQPFFNRGAMFSPDSRILALTMSLSAVRLCNPSTGEVLATLQVPDVAPLSLVGFSPDGGISSFGDGGRSRLLGPAPYSRTTKRDRPGLGIARNCASGCPERIAARTD